MKIVHVEQTIHGNDGANRHVSFVDCPSKRLGSGLDGGYRERRDEVCPCRLARKHDA